MPAYIVFTDATLRDLARKMPSTPAEFLRITGVGETKLAQYGDAMIDTIRAYLIRARRRTD